MTLEEAQQAAIAAGALQPQGIAENMAAGVEKHRNWFFQWSQTPRAQGRLQAWSEAILDGMPPHECKRQLG